MNHTILSVVHWSHIQCSLGLIQAIGSSQCYLGLIQVTSPVEIVQLHYIRLQCSLNFSAYTLAMQRMINAYIQHPSKDPSRYIMDVNCGSGQQGKSLYLSRFMIHDQIPIDAPFWFLLYSTRGPPKSLLFP